MKKALICAGLLAAYCIPWVYFALHGDATGGTMLMYGIMLLAHAALCVLSVKTKNAWVAPVGCVLSGVISVICVRFSVLYEMSYFFKPFTAVGLATVVSVVLLGAETAAVIIWKKVRKV